MNKNERDTHFQNFAKLLYEELSQHTKSNFMEQVDTIRFMREQYTIIAQRAYDLAFHTLDGLSENEVFLFNTGERKVEEIVPDLTEWPPIP